LNIDNEPLKGYTLVANTKDNTYRGSSIVKVNRTTETVAKTKVVRPTIIVPIIIKPFKVFVKW